MHPFLVTRNRFSRAVGDEDGFTSANVPFRHRLLCYVMYSACHGKWLRVEEECELLHSISSHLYIRVRLGSSPFSYFARVVPLSSFIDRVTIYIVQSCEIKRQSITW